MPASMHPASKGMSAFRPALLSAVLALAGTIVLATASRDTRGATAVAVTTLVCAVRLSLERDLVTEQE